MYKFNKESSGFCIENIATCDFSMMDKISNDELLLKARGSGSESRVGQYIENNMGIESRYWVRGDDNSYTIAKNALENLLKRDPSLQSGCDFIIFCGISNPLPTTCLSALLSCELEIQGASCWDLKSGCSTGVLALLQAVQWFDNGAKRGIIVCSETFSKFANLDVLQMSASVGDGACAFSVKKDSDFRLLSAVHGSDPKSFKSMYVPGTYPVAIDAYEPEQYKFHFSDKNRSIEESKKYWVQSLGELLQGASIKGEEVAHYIPHQVDAEKNQMIARFYGIRDEAIAMNFKSYGNMGCPSVFINYHFWMQDRKIGVGENIILHAVGGGLSWAGLCLKRLN